MYKRQIQDYIEIIKTTSRDGNENYFSGSWRSNANDYKTAAAALEGRFNDDKGYVQKLVSTIQEHDLTSYDATEPVTPPVAQPAAAAPEQAKEYTVQSGDTVNSITNQFGIGVQEFTDWNNIDDSGNIYEGQKVVVGNGTASEAAPVAQTAPVETAAPVENTTPVVEQQSVANVTPTPEVTPAAPAEVPTSTADALKQEPAAPVQKEEAPAQQEQTTQTPAPAETQTPEKQPEQTQQEQQTAPDQTQQNQQQEQQNQQQQQDQQQQQNQQQDQQQSTDATRGQQVVNEAEKYIGTPYVWGGKDTSGFDCSGLTQYVYKQVTGKDIGVWTVAQESSGTQIAVDQAQQGDLLFWGDQGSTYHVAISAGGDQYVHAPQPGENVKYGSTQYYTPDFGVRVY